MLVKMDAGRLALRELERDVLQMLADDAGPDRICEELGISEHALAAFFDSVNCALGTNSLAGAVAKAIRAGVIA